MTVPREVMDAANLTTMTRFFYRHQPMIWLVVGVLGTLGYGVVFPRDQIEELSGRVAHVEATIDTVRRYQRDNRRLLSGIARKTCIETPTRDWQLLDLPCPVLLAGQTLPPPGQ